MFFIFPYAIGRKTKKLPVITYGLIFINVVIYLASISGDFRTAVLLLGFKPDQNAWYTWFTHAFLHANLLHLGGNMIFLYAFGTFLEDIMGELKFISLYLLGALSSALLFSVINIIFIPQAAALPLIGASGAIAGLLGLAMIRFRRNDLHVFYFVWLLLIKWGTFVVKTYVAIVIYFSIEIISGLTQILSGSTGGVGHWAHVGGLLFGVLSASILNLKAEVVLEEKEDQAAGWLKAGNAVAAATKFEELIEDHPEKAEYYYMAGKAHLERDDRELAIKNITKAVELYVRERNGQKGCQVYEELLSYFPGTVLAQQTQFAVSSTCQSEGKFVLALEGFNSFLTAYPGDSRAELGLLRIGQLHEKMGEIDKAIAVFEQFLTKYPLSEWTSWVKKWLGQHEPSFNAAQVR